MIQDIIPTFIGFLAGIFSGMLGIGGAIVMKPLLRIFLDFPGMLVVGTPMAVAIPTTLVGAYEYTKKKNVSFKKAFPCIVCGIISTPFGAMFTKYFTGKQMMIITSIFLFSLFIKLQKQKKNNKDDNKKELDEKTMLKYSALAGLLAGFLAGFLGIGGGSVLVPILHIVLGIDMHTAVGLSLLTIPFFLIFGTITHYSLGNIHTIVALTMLIGTLPGARLGSKIAMRLEEKTLKNIFSGLLLILGTSLLANELKHIFI